MRRRLLITYLTLLAATVAGLSVPLAIALAARNSQAVFIDRQGDTARFASLAEPALRTGQLTLLTAEIDQYYGMFGIATVVVGRDGHEVLAAPDGFVLTGAMRARLDTALSGGLPRSADLRWPWDTAPLIVAEPVLTSGGIIGATLTVSPTDGLRTAILRSWSVLAAVGGAVLFVGAAAAVPLSGWMLRPVRQLDDAAHALREGRFGGRVAVGSGPPELRRLAMSFNAMSDRIATLVERQRSFVSYASHQLRTPLATLRLCVENLEPSVRAAGRDDYRTVAGEIERLGQLCDALLCYARAEATADEAEEADAAGIADARVAVWGRAAERAGIRIIRKGSNHLPVRAAARALDQALDALLSNAVKFAGRGAEVRVSVEPAEEGWGEIHVADTGPGMPPEELARAAEPFWRRPGDQNVDGSGLGVTIAAALVTASGGRLDLMPAEPHGVHARIRLPRAGG